MAPLGQIFTPAAVADLTLSLALSGQPVGMRLLDPACGDGMFLVRAAARGIRIEGVEIDPGVATIARNHGVAAVQCADFFDLPPPQQLYDAVVGNPPYVRQEELGAAKPRIAARLAADWPALGAQAELWGGRADLALAFVVRALRFVRPGGRVAFVVSAALLDAGYGAALTTLLENRGRIAAVVTSPRERWFKDAAVHAVILVIERTDGVPGSSATLCARLRLPIAEVANRVGALEDLAAIADVRCAAPGIPLAPLLRAPPAWLAAASSPALVPLGTLATVRRGATSGANDFFYLSRAEAARWALEPDCLVPLLRTPRAADRIRLDPERLDTVAFIAGAAPPPNARAYVAAHARLAERPTLAHRSPWWSLALKPARLFLTKAYSARFVQPFATRPVCLDQRVYAIEPRPGIAVDLLAAVLNGTLTALALEALGRASLGQGALELSVADAEQLPVLDPRGLDAAAVRRAFAPLAARPMGDAFAEAAAPDRRALDQALAPPELAAQVSAFGPALAAGVDERLVRARTTHDG